MTGTGETKSGNPSAPRVWYAIDLVVEARASEAAQYALMEAGATGTEEESASAGLVRTSGYFGARPSMEAVRKALGEALEIYGLTLSMVRESTIRELADRDWLGEWKKSWEPVEVGSRFLIAPPWTTIDDPGGRIVVRIEPGMAFGTGTHETTQLSLRAIEKFLRGGAFVDVGTGTGILAIAAALLDPDVRITALDTDEDAIDIARENARLNGAGERIEFLAGTLDGTREMAADLVCANLTADVIVELLPGLLKLNPGRLVLSGILTTQEDLIRSALGELDSGPPREMEIMKDGEWVAIIV